MLEWLTGALALMTGWLAFETRRMSRATLQMANLQAEPDLGISGCSFDIADGVDPQNPAQMRQGIRPKFTLLNPSLVRVTYTLRECLVTIANVPKPMMQIENAVGVVHPKATLDYFYTFIEVAHPIPEGFSFKLNLVADFWAVPEIRSTLSCKLECILENAARGALKWVFLEGPVYT